MHFNSHPHKEDDGEEGNGSVNDDYFNSHPHKEDDGSTVPVESIAYISTHILTRRMTLSVRTARLPVIFQLTSSQGG